MTRLLVPGYRPGLCLSWYAIGATLIASAAVLLALWSGVSGVVQIGAQILTPQERIRRVAEVEETHGNGAALDDKHGYILHGVLRTDDGEPIPEGSRVSLISSRRGVTATFRAALEDDRFSGWVSAGQVFVRADAPGYAVELAGPFEPSIEGLPEAAVVLRRGFTATIRVVDAAGSPLQGATITASLQNPVNASTPLFATVASDGNGVALIEHCSALETQLTASAPGYAQDRKDEVRLSPDEPLTWTLRPAKITRGVVVRHPDGQPVVDAVIRIAVVSGPAPSSYAPDGNAPEIARTNEKGEFSLTSLRSDSFYHLLVDAPGRERQLLREVGAGQEELRVALGPELYVRGTVVGSPERVKNLILNCNSPIHVRSRVYRTGRDVELTRQDDKISFEIRDVLRGKLEITGGNHGIELDVTEPIDDLVYDLTEKKPKPRPRQRITLVLEAPAGHPPPEGIVIAQSFPTPRGKSVIHRDVSIEDGRAEIEVYVPGRLVVQRKKLAGYAFEDHQVHLDANTSSSTVTVPVSASGAIYGHVVSPTGSVALESVNISCYERDKPEQGQRLTVHEIDVDADGSFVVPSLPLGKKYVVIAQHEKYRTPSAPIDLDKTQPLREIRIEIGDGVEVEGRLVGPNGEPLSRVAVELRLKHEVFGTGWGPPAYTTPDGVFRLGKANPELDYTVTIQSRRDYQPATLEFRRDGRRMQVTLQKGSVLEGQLLEESTGWPIPGAKVYVLHPTEDGESGLVYDAEKETDARGRFRFSNLPNEPVAVSVRLVNSFGSSQVTPGSDVPLEIRGRIPKGSPLKAFPPGDSP